jgi:hypothetical protein
MRQLWEKMKPALDNGVALVVQVDKETRTQDQNALYHSIINQIAKQARHLGSTWDTESWKRLLVDTYTREHWAKFGASHSQFDRGWYCPIGASNTKIYKSASLRVFRVVDGLVC